MSAVPKPAPVPPARDPDLDRPIDELIGDLVPDIIPDAGAWKMARNPSLGLYRPVDLIGTPREGWVRDLLRAVKQGAFS